MLYYQIRTSEQQEPLPQLFILRIFKKAQVYLVLEAIAKLTQATHWTDEVIKPKYKDDMNAKLRAMPKRFLSTCQAGRSSTVAYAY